VSKLFQKYAERLRVAKWKWDHRDFLAVFNWHQVTPEFDPARHHVYTWTRLDDFAKEVEWVAAEFRVLPLHRAIVLHKRRELRGACAAFTFDDGDVSVAEHVEPWLRRRGLPATFFINSAYLDGHGSYWFPVLSHSPVNANKPSFPGPPDELREKAQHLRKTNDPIFYDEVRKRLELFAAAIPHLDKRLVSREWLADLDGEQYSIGAHGHEHQRYSMMPPEWQRDDLRENVRQLSLFRGFRPVFAVPFGRAHDWTDETMRIAYEQGLEVLLAEGGINVARCSSYLRISCDGKKVAPLVRAVMDGSVA
jgi:peptidoglycan/xylan/chitin deacetylase (PgdA/CDA1 family)